MTRHFCPKCRRSRHAGCTGGNCGCRCRMGDAGRYRTGGAQLAADIEHETKMRAIRARMDEVAGGGGGGGGGTDE